MKVERARKARLPDYTRNALGVLVSDLHGAES
jgi:hypothetical protein